MEKIEVKDNPLKLDVYINGTPDLSLVPEDLMNAYISALTETIIELIQKEKK